MQALSLSEGVSRFLQERRTGHVLATYVRSCYLDLDGRIVAVVSADLLNGPLNVVVSVPPGFAFTSIPVGTPVTAAASLIRLKTVVDLSLEAASRWNARLSPWKQVPTAVLDEQLGALRSVVAAGAPDESFAYGLVDLDQDDLDDSLRLRARVGMRALRDGLSRADVSEVARATVGLAGLGGGLTPSGDDVLVGALIALAVLMPPAAPALRSAITRQVVHRTTRISLAYLEAAGEGEVSEAWHRLLAVLPRGGADVSPAAESVMAFGETSGADMLAGFLLAMDALRVSSLSA